MQTVAHATNSRNPRSIPHPHEQPINLDWLHEENERLRAENAILEQVAIALQKFARQMEDLRRAT
jgi:hypothetical protein